MHISWYVAFIYKTYISTITSNGTFNKGKEVCQWHRPRGMHNMLWCQKGEMDGLGTLQEKAQERLKNKDSANYAAIERVLAIPEG